jgi:hypothetical protein
MIRLKDLLNEGETKNPLIKRLLVELKPLIADIIEDTKQRYKKEDRVYSEFDAYYTEITLKYDMVKALEKYTQPTDKLSDVVVKNSSKGSFQIRCMVERDGVKYPFNTEVIYAGGYNIQKLHFRYLTKTTLPYTGQTAETQKLKAELARLSKGERLQKEIENNKKVIEYNQKLIDTNSKLSDKEILAKYEAGDNSSGQPYIWPSWEELVKRGAAQNYNNDEKYFNQQKKEAQEGNIEFWKRKNIGWKKEAIKTAEQNIVKAQKKLDALANS